MNRSRGNCITAYSPAFAKGAKVFSAQLSGILTGVASAGITAPYIGSAAVTKEKIGANAVRAEKISAGAVTNAKIGSAAVTKEKIGANAVRTEKISAGAVTFAKQKASYVTGTIAADSTVYAVAHGLGSAPSVVMVSLRSTPAKLNQSASSCVGEVTVSARTATNVYIAGSAGTGYAIYSVL